MSRNTPRPAETVTLTGSPPASQVVRTGSGAYRGFAFRETAGTTVVIVLWDNASTSSGKILETILLPANGSAGIDMSDGRKYSAGIYAQITGSGTLQGSVFYT